MTERPLPPAANGTEVRLDVLIALQRAGNEALRDLCAILRPAEVVDLDPVSVDPPLAAEEPGTDKVSVEPEPIDLTEPDPPRRAGKPK